MSSPDLTLVSNNSPTYPLKNLSDPFFNATVDGDERHSFLISKQVESVYQNSKNYSNQSYIKDLDQDSNSSIFINTCEIFPDFDPQLLLLQFRNEHLVGIDNLRDDEGIDKENDDANRVSYYNEDNDDQSSSVSSTQEFDFNCSNKSFNYLSTITNAISQSNPTNFKRPLRRISTPNLTPQLPIICNQKNCHKSFSNKNDYKKHLRSHNILTFQCPYHVSMPKHKGKHIFNRMDVWKRHLRTFHFEFNPGEDSNQGLGRCRVCGEFFDYFNIFADEHIEYCAKRLRYQLKA